MKRSAAVLFAVVIAIATSTVGHMTPAYAASTVQVWLTTGDGASQLAQQPSITLGPEPMDKR